MSRGGGHAGCVLVHLSLYAYYDARGLAQLLSAVMKWLRTVGRSQHCFPVFLLIAFPLCS